MRYWVTAAFCAAMMSASVNRAAAAGFAIKLNEQDREYRNTGFIILRDPTTRSLLGSYKFATGRFGRGSAPFGTYELGAFRGTNDDPYHIGPRWMIKQQGPTGCRRTGSPDCRCSCDRARARVCATGVGPDPKTCDFVELNAFDSVEYKEG